MRDSRKVQCKLSVDVKLMLLNFKKFKKGHKYIATKFYLT